MLRIFSSSSHPRHLLPPFLLISACPAVCFGSAGATAHSTSHYGWELATAFLIALFTSVLISRFFFRRIASLADKAQQRRRATARAKEEAPPAPELPQVPAEGELHYAALTEFMRMIAKAIDERTSYLRGHSERVALYSAAIGRELRMDPALIERIRLSALLHDIGTIGIDDELVRKDASLTPEEFEILKAHTVKGASILRPIPALNDLIPGLELHHESLDGTGYPYGLKRDQIPMMARIIAVADSFDAMTTERPYQGAMDPDYVLEVMQRLAGIHYDESAVAALTVLVTKGAIVVRKSQGGAASGEQRVFGEAL